MVTVIELPFLDKVQVSLVVLFCPNQKEKENVSKNSSYFLVDPGAVSTQVLSPNSRELIDRAICMSGSALLFYSYLDANDQRERMFAFAGQLNASVTDFEGLTKFLQTVNAETIAEFTSQKSVDRLLVFDWAPVIESTAKPKVQFMLIDDNYGFRIFRRRCDSSVPFIATRNDLSANTNYECFNDVRLHRLCMPHYHAH